MSNHSKDQMEHKYIICWTILWLPFQVAFRATNCPSQNTQNTHTHTHTHTTHTHQNTHTHTHTHTHYTVSSMCHMSSEFAYNQAQLQTFIQNVALSISDGTMTSLIKVFRGLPCWGQLLNTGKTSLFKINPYSIEMWRRLELRLYLVNDETCRMYEEAITRILF